MLTLRLSPDAVSESIEANLVDSSLALGRSTDGVVFRGSEVAWVYTGKKALSRVLRPRFDFGDVADRVEEISECFRQWDAPVSWIVGPTARPAQIGEVLRDNGYGNTEVFRGMALDLTEGYGEGNHNRFTADFSRNPSGDFSAEFSAEPSGNFGTDFGRPAPQPGRIRIERVSDSRSLVQWATICDQPDTDEPGPAQSDVESAVSLFSPENAGGDPRCRYYLGYFDGKPVARGMAFVRGETVGLYWIESLPTCRDKGVDRLLISKALSDARRGGAVTAVALAGDRLAEILTGIGFESYCRFRVYSWPPEPIKMPSH